VRLVTELERSWREARERRGFRLVHYSVQGNHVHAIVEAASARELACGMKSIAARFARSVNRVFRRAGRVLADRSHVHVLRSPREVRHAIAYVLLNARRHAAKLGRLQIARGHPRQDTRVDPASSGRWFSGWRCALPAPRDPPAVAAPRTWLLGIGWRRCGLIGSDEIPGARGTQRAGERS